MTMRKIEIDFDVHQQIEAERRGFDDPPTQRFGVCWVLVLPNRH